MSDVIEKVVVLKASRERVWKAISDSSLLGIWFGAEFDGPFEAGKKVSGRIVPTKMDPETAKFQEAHRGMPMVWEVVAIEPMTRFAYRWHPGAVDLSVDYSKEATTLVELRLEDASGGTKLTITESGFEHIPLARRAQVFDGNSQGWAAQARLIAKYVEG
jgi:uncharacterized protein YndB with AHSA1/START domain